MRRVSGLSWGFVGNQWLNFALSLPLLAMVGHIQLSLPEEKCAFLSSALLWDIFEEIPIYFTLYPFYKNLGI